MSRLLNDEGVCGFHYIQWLNLENFLVSHLLKRAPTAQVAQRADYHHHHLTSHYVESDVITYEVGHEYISHP
jgi:hypothetical protein